MLELVESNVVREYVADTDVLNSLHFIRIAGLNAVHGRKIRPKDATLTLENVTYLVGLIAAKESGTVAAYQKPPYMSEAETRRLYVDRKHFRLIILLLIILYTT